MTPQARQIIGEIAALRGVPLPLLTGRCRRYCVVSARIEIALKLNARGYSTTRIGMILQRDHTTIVYYLGRGKRHAARRRWRAPKVRHLRWLTPPALRLPKRYLRPYAGAYMPEYHWEEA